MKKIILSVTEFMQFRELAIQRQIKFEQGSVKKATIQVTAKAAELEEIGY